MFGFLFSFCSSIVRSDRQSLREASAAMAKKELTPVIREYTINVHKRIHGVYPSSSLFVSSFGFGAVMSGDWLRSSHVLSPRSPSPSPSLPPSIHTFAALLRSFFIYCVRQLSLRAKCARTPVICFPSWESLSTVNSRRKPPEPSRKWRSLHRKQWGRATLGSTWSLTNISGRKA